MMKSSIRPTNIGSRPSSSTTKILLFSLFLIIDWFGSSSSPIMVVSALSVHYDDESSFLEAIESAGIVTNVVGFESDTVEEISIPFVPTGSDGMLSIGSTTLTNFHIASIGDGSRCPSNFNDGNGCSIEGTNYFYMDFNNVDAIDLTFELSEPTNAFGVYLIDLSPENDFYADYFGLNVSESVLTVSNDIGDVITLPDTDPSSREDAPIFFGIINLEETFTQVNFTNIYETQASIYIDKITYGLRLDPDNDGIASDIDNCPDHYNRDQLDLDGDGIGDVCDDDVDICSCELDIKLVLDGRNLSLDGIFDDETISNDAVELPLPSITADLLTVQDGNTTELALSITVDGEVADVTSINITELVPETTLEIDGSLDADDHILMLTVEVGGIMKSTDIDLSVLSDNITITGSGTLTGTDLVLQLSTDGMTSEEIRVDLSALAESTTVAGS